MTDCISLHRIRGFNNNLCGLLRVSFSVLLVFGYALWNTALLLMGYDLSKAYGNKISQKNRVNLDLKVPVYQADCRFFQGITPSQMQQKIDSELGEAFLYSDSAEGGSQFNQDLENDLLTSNRPNIYFYNQETGIVMNVLGPIRVFTAKDSTVRTLNEKKGNLAGAEVILVLRPGENSVVSDKLLGPLGVVIAGSRTNQEKTRQFSKWYLGMIRGIISDTNPEVIIGTLRSHGAFTDKSGILECLVLFQGSTSPYVFKFVLFLVNNYEKFTEAEKSLIANSLTSEMINEAIIYFSKDFDPWDLPAVNLRALENFPAKGNSSVLSSAISSDSPFRREADLEKINRKSVNVMSKFFSPTTSSRRSYYTSIPRYSKLRKFRPISDTKGLMDSMPGSSVKYSSLVITANRLHSVLMTSLKSHLTQENILRIIYKMNDNFKVKGRFISDILHSSKKELLVSISSSLYYIFEAIYNKDPLRFYSRLIILEGLFNTLRSYFIDRSTDPRASRKSFSSPQSENVLECINSLVSHANTAADLVNTILTQLKNEGFSIEFLKGSPDLFFEKWDLQTENFFLLLHENLSNDRDNLYPELNLDFILDTCAFINKFLVVNNYLKNVLALPFLGTSFTSNEGGDSLCHHDNANAITHCIVITFVTRFIKGVKSNLISIEYRRFSVVAGSFDFGYVISSLRSDSFHIQIFDSLDFINEKKVNAVFSFFDNSNEILLNYLNSIADNKDLMKRVTGVSELSEICLRDNQHYLMIPRIITEKRGTNKTTSFPAPFGLENTFFRVSSFLIK